MMRGELLQLWRTFIKTGIRGLLAGSVTEKRGGPSHRTEDDENVSTESQVGLQCIHLIYVYVYCIYELNYNTNYA
ncbi:hypothetical protein AMELA_G00018400, partial [Ameiurus melas]